MRARVSLVKVKSCSALLHVVLVCISIYLNSVLRYRVLIFDTYRPVLYIYVSKDVRIRGYFSKPKGILEKKNLGIAAIDSPVVCLTVSS
jgi:hypothetical protein